MTTNYSLHNGVNNFYTNIYDSTGNKISPQTLILSKANLQRSVGGDWKRAMHRVSYCSNLVLRPFCPSNQQILSKVLLSLESPATTSNNSTGTYGLFLSYDSCVQAFKTKSQASKSAHKLSIWVNLQRSVGGDWMRAMHRVNAAAPSCHGR